MVKFIAHRGNWDGAQPDYENTKEYLEFAYHDKGYDVEVDLQAHRGILYYGHDDAQQVADLSFLQLPGVWCHAKNIEALILLMNMRTNCFWHDVDKCTLTSNGNIWCYPGVHIQHPNAVWLDLLNEPLPNVVRDIYGYCGDKINENINNGVTGQR